MISSEKIVSIALQEVRRRDSSFYLLQTTLLTAVHESFPDEIIEKHIPEAFGVELLLNHGSIDK